MIPIIVCLDVPPHIALGLMTGSYERVGGVVRTTDTKQVVLWLRETSPAAIGPLSMLTPGLLTLSSAASIISLGVSVATFVVLSERLDQLDARLGQVQRTIDQLGRRVNVLYDAQIRAAFTTAHTAFTLTNPINRNTNALVATNQLTIAQHQLTALADEHLQQATQTADEYLLLLMLAHLYEVRCFLELEELEHAQTRLRAGIEAVRPRVERYVYQLLTNNPVVYLQPALTQRVNLERLSQIFRWLDPIGAATSGAVFEKLRTRIFEFQHTRDDWIQGLPTSIWDPTLFPSAESRPRAVQRTGDWFGPLGDVLTSKAKQVAQQVEKIQQGGNTFSGHRDRVFDSLVQAVSDMETMIETYQRFASYQDEIQGIRELGLTFQQWSQLLPENPQLAGTVIYLQRADAVPPQV